jgi:catechol 2,3-dioxygenase-like lactoylglutathione lyase family enzyme
MLSPPIPVTRIVHTIHATVDIDACRLLYQDALGGLVFAEGYFPPEDRDMALLYVANHMIEPMAPRNPADMSMPFARLSNKIGQCYHSFELKVEDGKSSSQALREAGCKVASDYGVFFFVRPESTGGILLEVCETPMPNDPYDRKGWNAKSGNGHASSVLRINHIACVVADLEKALHFFCSLIAGEIISDERVLLPQQGRKVMTQIGDCE